MAKCKPIENGKTGAIALYHRVGMVYMGEATHGHPNVSMTIFSYVSQEKREEGRDPLFVTNVALTEQQFQQFPELQREWDTARSTLYRVIDQLITSAYELDPVTGQPIVLPLDLTNAEDA